MAEGNEVPVETDVAVGISDGNLVCKFNLNVMPGMSKAWCVVDVKRWKMMATCCGDLDGKELTCWSLSVRDHRR